MERQGKRQKEEIKNELSGAGRVCGGVMCTLFMENNAGYDRGSRTQQ